MSGSVPVAQWLEHCVSSAKVVGSIPRECIEIYRKCIACKSLWIKVSAKCINEIVKCKCSSGGSIASKYCESISRAAGLLSWRCFSREAAGLLMKIQLFHDWRNSPHDNNEVCF